MPAQHRDLQEGAAILRRRDVEARTGLSRSTLYELVARGEFPRPVRLTARAVGWIELEVSAWVNARVQERDEGQARAA